MAELLAPLLLVLEVSDQILVVKVFFSDLVKPLGFTQAPKTGTREIWEVKVRPGVIPTMSNNYVPKVY